MTTPSSAELIALEKRLRSIVACGAKQYDQVYGSTEAVCRDSANAIKTLREQRQAALDLCDHYGYGTSLSGAPDAEHGEIPISELRAIYEETK